MAAELNLGVVGLGGWGKNVVRCFSRTKRSRLKYICDSNRDTLSCQANLYPNSIAVESYETLLQDDQLDAIAIATPVPFHHKMARAALLAGKHVYVEKPMTLNHRDAADLVSLAEKTGLKLMVGHLLKYHPAVEFIKNQVEEGELGELYYMYCQRLNLGVFRQKENAVWSLAPHDISVILYLFGMQPEEIIARGACYLQSGVEDIVFANLLFPDKKMAQIHVSWLDPNKERKMVLVGSKKMLVFDDMQPSEKIRIFDKGAISKNEPISALQAIDVRHGDIHIPHLPPKEPLNIETQHFVDCVLDDKCPRSDGHDGMHVVKILEEIDKQLHGNSTENYSLDYIKKSRVAA